MTRHLVKFRWKTISIAIFFFLLGNLISLFFVPINRKCIPESQEYEYNAVSHSKLQNPDLVILILSAPTNINKRNVIRETWWHLVENIRKDQDNVKIKHYFVIGDLGLSEPDIQKLKDEHIRYNDILSLPMYDTYSNLTEKVIKSFNWLIGEVDFKYVLKCDDDSFVRIDHLIHELIHLEIIYLKSTIEDVTKINDNTSPYISVNIQLNTMSSHGNRDLYWGYMHGAATIFRKGKWKEPSWISCDHYAPYALGGGYVISKNLVKYIAKSKWYLRYYNSEDVSVGAWLAPVNNIVRIHDRRFDTEYISRGCQNYYLVRHNIPVDEMKAMYSNLKDKQQLCTQERRTGKEYIYDWSVPPSKCCNRVIE